MGKKPFKIKMHFSFDEYARFVYWYENECYKGLNSFAFPKIDSVNKPEREYRFVAGVEPKFENISSTIIECTMEWEEV